jgi:cysteine desulfuration protein SufE
MANPVEQRAEEIAEEFAFLDDWEARFAHLIDMGRRLPPMPADELVETNKVPGCASQVWMTARPSEAQPGALAFRGASDAMIVAGLVALILRLHSDQRPADILAFDAEGFFRRIGVSDALTPQRSNGLRSMLARIRAEAQAAA